MKKALFFTIFMCVTSLYAQQESPPLYLEYDDAGNQVLSDLVCVNCPGAVEKHSLDQVTWYPNPVAQELIFAWENTDKTHVTAVNVYALNGKLVASRDKLNPQSQLSLNFGNKAAGIYIIEVISSDDRKKSFKIIKK